MYCRQPIAIVVLLAVALSLSCRTTSDASCHYDAEAPPSTAAGETVETEEAAPPVEDELGVAGAPINETKFDFEPEPDEGAPQLEVVGVPEIPAALAEALRPYLDSQRVRLQSIASDASSITFISRIGQTAQAHRITGPGGEPTQLTFGDEPVAQFTGVPKIKGAYTFRTDVGGSEDYQIVRVDRDEEAVMLTDGQSRHGPFVWSPTGEFVAFTGNARDPEHMDLYLAGNARDSQPRLLLQREGAWTASAWSADGKKLLIRDYRAYNHSTFHIVDVEGGTATPLAPIEEGVAYTRARFDTDGTILTVSNRGGEFLDLYRVDPTTDAWENLTADLQWDVGELALYTRSGRLAYTTNENGVSRLWLHDAPGRTEIELPMGIVSSLRFARGGEVLAFTLDRPAHTGDAYVHDLTTNTLTRWTDSMAPDVDRTPFVEPEPIRFKSFDDRAIPAWMYVPEGPGPHPVLIWVHGGPESQYQPAFNPILQYIVTQLGIAVIGPNIRGSTGYGKTYASLDNARQREDAVRDIGALLDYIEATDALDAGRVGIYGGSYGGYVVLASLIRYQDRLAAGIDMVGVSNFVTFLENTRSYRTENRRAEYGDERDPQMHAFLQEVSPTTQADRITSPLFIVHGANDPRVPLSEARQMFDAVREGGQEAWLMVAHDEGHGFSKRHNRDAFYRAFVLFLRQHLIGAEEADAAGEDADDDETASEPS